MNKGNRILEIDFTRGIAVLLMIIAHIGMFGLITFKNFDKKINLNSSAIMFDGIGTIAHTLFILLVGVNMVTSFNHTKKKFVNESEDKIKREFAKKNIRRAIVIFCLGILISVIVKVVFGKWFVFFGIFQFIAVSILLAIPFTIYYKDLINIIAVIVILLVSNLSNNYHPSGLSGFLTGNISNKYLDYFPIIPYFSFVLIGITLGNILKHTNISGFNKKENVVTKKIIYMGQNSIKIYFVHLVTIFAVMKLIFWNKMIKI